MYTVVVSVMIQGFASKALIYNGLLCIALDNIHSVVYLSQCCLLYTLFIIISF